MLEKAVRDIKALLAEGGVSPDEDEDLIVDDLHLWTISSVPWKRESPMLTGDV